MEIESKRERKKDKKTGGYKDKGLCSATKYEIMIFKLFSLYDAVTSASNRSLECLVGLFACAHTLARARAGHL